MSAPASITLLRVEFSTVEDARRRVFFELASLPDERKRARLAGSIAASLRDAGLLARSVEQHYSAADLGALLGRSAEHVGKLARRGEFGPVAKDAGGYLIPASGVQSWLDAHAVVVADEQERAA